MSETEQKYRWPDPKNQSDETWPPTLRPDIQRYADHLYDIADDDDPDARSVVTIDRYMQDFHWFEEFLRVNDLEVEEIDAFDALEVGKHLGDKYSGSTAGTRYRNIRKLYQFLLKARKLSENPLSDWELGDDLGIHENRSEQSKHLDNGERFGPTVAEIKEMEENAGEEHRLRNQLIIRLFFNTGCRCAELRGIRLDDIQWEDREIELRPETTKYGIPRTVAYRASCEGLLREWVDGGYRDVKAYGGWSEYLFPTDQSPQISTDTIEDIVKDAADRAELNRELWCDANGNSRSKITPHNIRYSTGYYMLFDEDDNARDDANIYKVSKYLGHSSVDVTQGIYIDDNPRAGVDAGHELMPV